MRSILRFPDLKERKVVNSWPQLKRLVDNEAFPEGFMLSQNSRAWFEDEVEAWLESRPAASKAKPPLRGGAAQRTGKKRDAEIEALYPIPLERGGATPRTAKTREAEADAGA